MKTTLFRNSLSIWIIVKLVWLSLLIKRIKMFWYRKPLTGSPYPKGLSKLKNIRENNLPWSRGKQGIHTESQDRRSHLIKFSQERRLLNIAKRPLNRNSMCIQQWEKRRTDCNWRDGSVVMNGNCFCRSLSLVPSTLVVFTHNKAIQYPFLVFVGYWMYMHIPSPTDS